LGRIRADQLLAASVASSRPTLEAILAESEAHARAAKTVAAKSLGDPGRDLVYTPLMPCRMIDTRGFGAPLQGGPFPPDTRRAYTPNGLCGLPTSGLAAIVVSFTTENHTPNSGGYIAMVGPGAGITASVDVFNIGSEWSASNTTVPTGPAAEFDVYVSLANAEVVVDVLGYFSTPPIDSVTPVWVDNSGNIVGRSAGVNGVLTSVQGEAILLILTGYAPLGATWQTSTFFFDGPNCTGTMYVTGVLLGGHRAVGVYRDAAAQYQLVLGASNLVNFVVKSAGSIDSGAATCTDFSSPSSGFGWPVQSTIPLQTLGTPPFFIR
jgi:hypothetical protein